MHHLLQFQIGNEKIAEMLIKAGINIDAQDIHGCTAIHRSAQHGTIEVTDLLIKSHANLNIPDNEMHTPFGYAERSSYEQQFRDVLKKNGKKQRWTGSTFIADDTDALLEAAEEGIIAFIKFSPLIEVALVKLVFQQMTCRNFKIYWN